MFVIWRLFIVLFILFILFLINSLLLGGNDE